MTGYKLLSEVVRCAGLPEEALSKELLLILKKNLNLTENELQSLTLNQLRQALALYLQDTLFTLSQQEP